MPIRTQEIWAEWGSWRWTEGLDFSVTVRPKHRNITASCAVLQQSTNGSDYVEDVGVTRVVASGEEMVFGDPQPHLSAEDVTEVVFQMNGSNGLIKAHLDIKFWQ